MISWAHCQCASLAKARCGAVTVLPELPGSIRGAQRKILHVSHAWILQANPKLYEVDAALREKPIIYWRIPQYSDQVKVGDRALIWRAGKQAGLVGWGVFRADPQRYDVSRDHDPFAKEGLRDAQNSAHAPVSVWPGGVVSKEEVAAVLPAHRIVTAPMGTVFPLDADDLAALQPLLNSHGYELDRVAGNGFESLPVLPEAEHEPTRPPDRAQIRAKITPALFLLSSTPEQPVEVTIEGDALRLLLVERDSLRALDEQWDAVGVYLLIGKPTTDGATLGVYVGKAQGLRSRTRTGHGTKDWTRCLLIQREGLHPFNASDISWLERRLIDVLLEAPQIDLVNKTPPPLELVPDYKAEILERTVVATLGLLGVLGAYVV